NRRGSQGVAMKQYSWVVLVISVGAAAQSLPRLEDGKPNLNGIWQVMNSANFDVQPHPAQDGIPASVGVVEGGEIPYQAWALEKKNQNYGSRATAEPEKKCFLPGVPRLTYIGLPFQIFQGTASDKITILSEYAHTNRYIYTNGSKHPPGHIDWWMGDSRGR